MGKNLNGFLAVSLCLAACHASAASFDGMRYKTTVLVDGGGVPISKYIPDSAMPDDHGKKLFEDRGRKKLLSSQYPVRTPSMSVGPVSASELEKLPKNNVVVQPMFIIGYDRVSMAWLQNNKEFLRSNHAIGLVVNVDNAQQMDQLIAIAGEGVRMQPTPGEDMAEHMGIRHYPFYIDKNGVMR
tara:strand:+ start:7425 stop:7976 length:552 start_codon:yes stop_codon:yes gene_type:complete